MTIKEQDRLPKIRLFDHHLWVDYFELLTILDPDGQLTYSDIKDQLSPDSSDLDLSLEDDSIDDSSKERLDKFEMRYRDYFALAQSKSKIYAESYPFSVTQDVIEMKKDNITDEHIAYTYLLLCSQLRVVDGTSQSTLTTDYEVVSCGFLQKFLNSNNTGGPFVFGKNSANLANSYSGNAQQRLQKLADDLGGELRKADFPPTSTGDSGIDIVAWYCPWDKLSSRFLYVGQCKCSDEWINSTDAKTCIERVIDLNNDVNNLFFVPFHYRKADGTWHEHQHSYGKILIDRARLMKDFPMDKFKVSSSYTMVKDLLRV